MPNETEFWKETTKKLLSILFFPELSSKVMRERRWEHKKINKFLKVTELVKSFSIDYEIEDMEDGDSLVFLFQKEIFEELEVTKSQWFIDRIIEIYREYCLALSKKKTQKKKFSGKTIEIKKEYEVPEEDEKIVSKKASFLDEEGEKIKELMKENNELNDALEKHRKVLKCDLTYELKKIRKSAVQFPYHFKKDIEEIEKAHVQFFYSPANSKNIDAAEITKNYFTRLADLFKICADFTKRSVESKAKVELEWAREIARLKVQYQNEKRLAFSNYVRDLAIIENDRDEWKEIAIDLADELELELSKNKFLLKKAVKQIGEIEQKETIYKQLEDNQLARIKKLETDRQFLIQKSVDLAGQIISLKKEMARRVNLSQQTIDQLEAKIAKLEAHACSGCHEPTHIDYDQIKQDKQNLTQERDQLKTERNQFKEQKENLTTERDNLTSEKTTLQNEKTNLTKKTERLEKLATNLGTRTQKLTKFKKMLSDAVQDYKKELKENKSKFQNLDFEIRSLKQDKNDLNDKIELLRDLKKELYAEIRELKSENKEQSLSLNQKGETIQQLETEKQTQQTQINTLNSQKQTLEQEKETLLTKQKELLIEIELLKNPPRQANKENISLGAMEQKLRDQVQELSKQLSLEQVKKVNSILQEQKNYFNHHLEQKENDFNRESKTLQSSQGRRETIWWVTLVILITIVIGQTALLLRGKVKKKGRGVNLKSTKNP